MNVLYESGSLPTLWEDLGIRFREISVDFVSFFPCNLNQHYFNFMVKVILYNTHSDYAL